MGDGEERCECPSDLPCEADAVGLLPALAGGEVLALPEEAVGVAPARAEAVGWPGPGPPDADEPGRAPEPELPGLELPPPSGWLPCPGAEDEGGCRAAHCVNGACGPPDIATTRAPRQTVITAMVPNPANRKTWWRRPDGSENTGLESTPGL